jgi:hypothetical protein
MIALVLEKEDPDKFRDSCSQDKQTQEMAVDVSTPSHNRLFLGRRRLS